MNSWQNRVSLKAFLWESVAIGRYVCESRKNVVLAKHLLFYDTVSTDEGIKYDNITLVCVLNKTTFLKVSISYHQVHYL
jgi:hypothetical protein